MKNFFSGVVLVPLFFSLTAIVTALIYFCDYFWISVVLAALISGYLCWKIYANSSSWLHTLSALVGGILLILVILFLAVSSSRSKGVEAYIKSGLNTFRAQAELYYDSNQNSYLNLCTEDRFIQSVIQDIETTKSTRNDWQNSCMGFLWYFIKVQLSAPAELHSRVTCIDSESAYRIIATLSDTSNRLQQEYLYCVDNTGVAITTVKLGGLGCEVEE